jgi:hypothetical protein
MNEIKTTNKVTSAERRKVRKVIKKLCDSRKQLIIEAFKKHEINFDAGPANYVDDCFCKVQDAINELINNL